MESEACANGVECDIAMGAYAKDDCYNPVQSASASASHDHELESKLAGVAFAILHVDDSLQIAKAIVVELIGPKRVRLLHRSISEENQALMASIIQQYVRQDMPIPILSPAGGHAFVTVFFLQ